MEDTRTHQRREDPCMEAIQKRNQTCKVVEKKMPSYQPPNMAGAMFKITKDGGGSDIIDKTR